jgi:hypothetical protein
MVSYRSPGTICRTLEKFAGVEDGTLARMPSSRPVTLGVRADAEAPATTPTAAGPVPVTKLRPTAKGACAYLNPVPKGTVQAPRASFDRLRRASGAARISGPQAVAAHTWPDKSSSAAVQQSIEIDGQTITVIRPPESVEAGKNLPSTKELAEALRALPADQRANTQRIIVSPTPSPESTGGRVVGGTASRGEIELFPVPDAQSQNDFDNRVTHESGHNTQGKFWSSAADVSEWQRYADADKIRPSPYAAQGAGEDFCEFLILFNAARDTKCEKMARGIYPNRWKKMQGLLSP